VCSYCRFLLGKESGRKVPLYRIPPFLVLSGKTLGGIERSLRPPLTLEALLNSFISSKRKRSTIPRSRCDKGVAESTPSVGAICPERRNAAAIVFRQG
jgi:hypothetical protein